MPLPDEITNLRKLFAEAEPTDPKVLSNYGWTLVKVLLNHAAEIDHITARQLLADCIRLPLERPSKLHSALLSAAIKVAEQNNEFHFVPFLQFWDLRNLRPEDAVRQSDPKEPTHAFPSLVDRTVRRYALSRILRPQEELTEPQFRILLPELQKKGYQFCGEGTSASLVTPMLVTRIKEAVSKEGRKFHFVTLTSPQGQEMTCTTHQLLPSPLHPLPEGKRHYVNIGQLYDCLLRQKEETTSVASSASLSLVSAFLSQSNPKDYFPLEVGYIEHIDTTHGHMHVYDRHSRHFVAHILRFSKEQEGQFVQFLPIIPSNSKFKTAILTGPVATPVASPDGLVRPIRISSINQEKGYAVWHLLHESHPIQELLSSYQLSQAEVHPTYIEGYLPLELLGNPQQFTPNTLASYYNRIYSAVIFLHRGKDNIKRPRIARIWESDK